MRVAFAGILVAIYSARLAYRVERFELRGLCLLRIEISILIVRNDLNGYT